MTDLTIHLNDLLTRHRKLVAEHENVEEAAIKQWGASLFQSEPLVEKPGEVEWFEGKLTKVVNASRTGWWRFNEHYDRNGYCDNPGRGY